MNQKTRRHRPLRRDPGTRRQPVLFNMTPMIDVVFLLIIFFMLVSTFASAENVPLDLPNPDHSQARKVKVSPRVVINCLPADPRDPGRGDAVYWFGPNRAASLDGISERLAAAKRLNPEVQVVIRADRRLPFAPVRAVMQAVADNGIERMNLVAHVGTHE